MKRRPICFITLKGRFDRWSKKIKIYEEGGFTSPWLLKQENKFENKTATILEDLVKSKNFKEYQITVNEIALQPLPGVNTERRAEELRALKLGLIALETDLQQQFLLAETRLRSLSKQYSVTRRHYLVSAGFKPLDLNQSEHLYDRLEEIQRQLLNGNRKNQYEGGSDNVHEAF